MDPDDIQLISFFDAKVIAEEDEEMYADGKEEHAKRLSLHERYRAWFNNIDL